jgi:hypothetical protein
VSRALTGADAVLCALLAPDAWNPASGRSPRGGSRGGTLGDIILGRGRFPGSTGPTIGMGNTRSAGTGEIARDSGGDSMPVEDASALVNTLSRIRQRYALHFYVPEGARAGQERTVEVQLAEAALRRYPGAELRYRRRYVSPGGGGTVAASQPAEERTRTASRRPAVDAPTGPAGPSTVNGWPKAETAAPAETEPVPAAAPAPEPPAQGGGWRRIKPGEEP